jgi:hypothetical protein
MFVCSRCGSSYNARHIGVEHCPRCRLRDKVDSPLAFKAFDLSGLKTVSLRDSDRVSRSDSGAGGGSTAPPSAA